MSNQVVSKNEWDGKDFRGDKASKGPIEYLRQHPKVLAWLRKRPISTMNTSVSAFKEFERDTGIPIDQWLNMQPKEARGIVWGFIDKFSISNSGKADNIRGYFSSLYAFNNEESTLNFSHPKYRIDRIDKRIKYTMNKDIVWKIISKTRNMRDETILTIAFESGMRRNAIGGITYGHYKHFNWYKIKGDGDVEPSDEKNGDIIAFIVRSEPSLEYAFDRKQRKHGTLYFALLHKEATNLLRSYVEQNHKDSTDTTPLWNLNGGAIYHMFKACVQRTNLPSGQISFHALRRAFKHQVRNTPTITDNEFKEAIMGHKLRGAQEAYFDKDPLEFAREYAKIDFTPGFPEKDRQIERLTKQVEKYEDAIREAKATTTIKIQPLPELKQPGPPATREEINKAFNEFNGSNQTEANKPIQPVQTGPSPIPEPQPIPQPRPQMPNEEGWVACIEDKWVRKKDCEICQTTNFNKYSHCFAQRIKGVPNDIFFRVSKPKPQ